MRKIEPPTVSRKSPRITGGVKTVLMNEPNPVTMFM